MGKLFIEGRRTGYTTSQCHRTMTVRELAMFLEHFDDDTPVYIMNDNGYTFGEIDANSFHEDDSEEEEDD